MTEKPSLDRNRRYETLEDRLGYRFNDHRILERALTHTSARKGSDDNFHYENLEFLGDRVLALCVADRLYKDFASADEGELSLRLNALVRGNTLAQIADELDLHEHIRTGGDLKQVTGKRMQGVRADVVEALIGAMYLDGGLEATSSFIERILQSRFNVPGAARRDSKTALQEWAHAKQLGTPKYRETGKTGPDHDPVFFVEVKLKDTLAGQGSGRSKRAAEQMAAKAVLEREGVWQAR